jgi:hypothetical protein
MNPYLSAEGIAGVTLFLICVFFALYHSVRTSNFTTLHFSIVGLATLYGLGMPIVIYGAQEFHLTGNQFFQNSINYIILHTLFAAIAIFGIYLGWRSLSKAKRNRLGAYFEGTQSKKMAPWFFVMLIVSVLGMYLYTKDYGGFLGYFSYNRLVRAGHFHLVERSPFSFLRPFGGFAYVSAFGFWGLIISGRHRLLNYLGLVLALFVSVYVLLAFSGRLSMILFVSIFPVSIALVRRTNPLVWSIILPATAPIFMLALFFISDVFELKASENFHSFIVKEVSFPFLAFFAQISDGNTFQFFFHLILSPLYLLPSSFVGSWLSTASQINTATIHGAPKGVGGVTSGMPVDLITFGLMQFHVLGVFLYAIFFGWILRVITCISESFALRGVASAFTAYVALKIGIFGALYGDPKHIIEGNFAFIATLIAVAGIRVLRRSRII